MRTLPYVYKQEKEGHVGKVTVQPNLSLVTVVQC